MINDSSLHLRVAVDGVPRSEEVHHQSATIYSPRISNL